MNTSEIDDAICSDGSLHRPGMQFLDWRPGDEVASLDGDFCASELRQIADHMERIKAFAP